MSAIHTHWEKTILHDNSDGLDLKFEESMAFLYLVISSWWIRDYIRGNTMKWHYIMLFMLYKRPNPLKNGIVWCNMKWKREHYQYIIMWLIVLLSISMHLFWWHHHVILGIIHVGNICILYYQVIPKPEYLSSIHQVLT